MILEFFFDTANRIKTIIDKMKKIELENQSYPSRKRKHKKWIHPLIRYRHKKPFSTLYHRLTVDGPHSGGGSSYKILVHTK